jgi:uncharacterized membrane protein
MAKKNKYDTDPLDPDVADRAGEHWSTPSDPATAPMQPQPAPAQVRPIASLPYAESEAATRHFDESGKGYTAYHSVYEQPADVAAPGDLAAGQAKPAKKIIQRPTSRVVPGINLAENLTLLLPYLPFYLGGVAALIELFLVPRSETRARFHASQGLAMHIVAIAISTVLGLLNDFAGARIGGVAFSIAATVIFIVCMIRVWKGEPVHIAPVDDLSNWLNNKINPKK